MVSSGGTQKIDKWNLQENWNRNKNHEDILATELPKMNDITNESMLKQQYKANNRKQQTETPSYKIIDLLRPKMFWKQQKQCFQTVQVLTNTHCIGILDNY